MDAILWQAMAASTGDAITWRPDAQTTDPTEPPSPPSEDEAPREQAPPRAVEIPEPSEAQVRATLAEHGGNIVRAAQALGLTSRYVLYRLMRKHGIES
jgi:transcriptional regulator of acetoin/glycerol metabolism